MVNVQNLYFIGFYGNNNSFRPVEAGNLYEARKKFAKFHDVKVSENIVASRDYKEMTEGDKVMFEVTEEASRMLKDFLTKQKSTKAIRIMMQTG